MTKVIQLTEMQSRFVEEYFDHGKRKLAAIRAGYSALSASATAYENMLKPHIVEAIEQKKLERADKLDRYDSAKRIVDEQAECDALWADTVVPVDTAQLIAHITLQQELRRLHAAIEGIKPDEFFLDVVAMRDDLIVQVLNQKKGGKNGG